MTQFFYLDLRQNIENLPNDTRIIGGHASIPRSPRNFSTVGYSGDNFSSSDLAYWIVPSGCGRRNGNWGPSQ